MKIPRSLELFFLLTISICCEARSFVTGNKHRSKDVCLTPDCVKIASLLLNSMDETVDPCEDFYQFACGNWIKKNVIDDDKAESSVLKDISKSINVIIKNLLEDEKCNDKKINRHAKTFYKSCVNTELIEKENLTSAYSMLHSLGGWPVLGGKRGGNWNVNSFSLEQLLLKSLKLDSNIILGISACNDPDDSTKFIFCITGPKLGPPLPDYQEFDYSDDKQIAAYERYLREMAILFGADPVHARIQTTEMLEFEKELFAKKDEVRESFRNLTSFENKVNISYLETRYLKFDWSFYFNGILEQLDLNLSVNETTPVLNRVYQYLDVVDKLHEKPKRVIQNYVIWKHLMDLTDALPKRFRHIYTHLIKVVNGISEQSDRWVTCINEVNDVFSLVVGRLFMEETKIERRQFLVDDMVERIRKVVIDLIEEKAWLDECAKSRCKDKAYSMEKRIGFPSVFKNDTHLEMEYSDYVFNDPHYFQIILKTKNLKFRKTFEKLNNIDQALHWHENPIEVNAYYGTNVIEFPAGILQGPFFNAGYPQYINYAGIGSVIGHEFMHGFDNYGSKISEDEKVEQWWTNASIAEFETRIKCLEYQYGNFTVKGTNISLDSRSTLGNNIADNSGLKQSWMAYKNWVKTSNDGKEEPRLPGLNYTPRQLFFLSHAYHWCKKMRPEMARNTFKKRPSHSDSTSRINGPLQNNVEFADAFQCKEDSYMNPKKKCDVW